MIFRTASFLNLSLYFSALEAGDIAVITHPGVFLLSSLGKWELRLRDDSAAFDIDDPSGKQYAAVTGSPAHSRFARDWVAGLRFEVTSSLMLSGSFRF